MIAEFEKPFPRLIHKNVSEITVIIMVMRIKKTVMQVRKSFNSHVTVLREMRL